MAEKEKSKNTATDVMVSGMKAMTDLQNAGFGSTFWMGTAWLEAMSEVGSEVVKFIAARIQEDVKAQHNILHSNNAAEMQKVQAEFLQKAMEQYTAETGKIVEMSKELFSDAMKGVAPKGEKGPKKKGHSTPL